MASTTARGTRRDYVRATRTVELDGTEYVVHVYSICATDRVSLVALEARAGHSTIWSVEDHGSYGAVRARPLPAEIAALPIWSDERFAACDAFHVELDALAGRVIRAAYPELESLNVSHGDGSIGLRDWRREVRA